MKIRYTVIDPSKNITILVQTPICESTRRFAASEIMKAEPDAEQIGFISIKDDVCFLDMAGGEFCGNAVRSAAVLSSKEYVVCAGQKIKCEKEIAYLPKGIKGIKHYIVEMDHRLHKEDTAGTELKIKSLASDDDAVGIMFFDEKESVLTPLVYVPKADTLFWENSCASGSAAVCEYLLKKYNSAVNMDLNQPGGILHIESDPLSEYIMLSGKINIIKESEIELNDIN